MHPCVCALVNKRVRDETSTHELSMPSAHLDATHARALKGTHPLHTRTPIITHTSAHTHIHTHTHTRDRANIHTHTVTLTRVRTHSKSQQRSHKRVGPRAHTRANTTRSQALSHTGKARSLFYGPRTACCTVLPTMCDHAHAHVHTRTYPPAHAPIHPHTRACTRAHKHVHIRYVCTHTPEPFTHSRSTRPRLASTHSYIPPHTHRRTRTRTRTATPSHPPTPTPSVRPRWSDTRQHQQQTLPGRGIANCGTGISSHFLPHTSPTHPH